MAQIFLTPAGTFRWNVTSNVGLNAPNLIDDVELVRFAYACVAQNIKSDLRLKMGDVLSSCFTVGPYRSDLQDVIDAHQQIRGGTQDRHVSVERQSFIGGEQYDTSNVYMIAALNNQMIDVMGDMWPRLDLHSLAGGTISKTVRKKLRIDA